MHLFSKKIVEILSFKDMHFKSGDSDGKTWHKLFHYLNSFNNNTAFKTWLFFIFMVT